MNQKQKNILNQIKIILPNYDIEIIVKALELYLVNIKQCYHNDFLDYESYDKFYFTTWCLYHIFLNNLDYTKLQEVNELTKTRFCDIPLYKRISKEIINTNLEEYKKLVA